MLPQSVMHQLLSKIPCHIVSVISLGKLATCNKYLKYYNCTYAEHTYTVYSVLLLLCVGAAVTRDIRQQSATCTLVWLLHQRTVC